MAAIQPEDIERIIKKYHPAVAVTIQAQGRAPSTGSLRYEISALIEGVKLDIRLGENIVFCVGNAPMEVIKYTPLGSPQEMLAEIEQWIKNFEQYALKKEVPLVKNLARQYLGPEKSVTRHERHLVVEYEKFSLFVTPTLCLLVLKSDNRTVSDKKIESEKDIEDFFRVAAIFKDQIEKGQIK